MIFYLIFWFYSLTFRGGCCSGSRPGHLLMRRFVFFKSGFSMPKYPQAGILSFPPMCSLEYKCSIKRHFGIKKSPWVNEASCVKRFKCLSSAKKHYFQTSPFQISFLPVCWTNVLEKLCKYLWFRHYTQIFVNIYKRNSA